MYISICVLATLIGALQGYVRIERGVFYVLKYLEYFLLFFLVVNNLHSVKQAKVFIFFILLTSFFVCIYAWSQLPGGERLSAPFEATQGTEGEPNTFAGYLIIIMSLILGLILYAVSQKQRLLLIGLLIFTFIPFVFTLSRGGWLGFVMMYLSFILLSRKSKLALVSIFLCFVLFLPQFMPKRVEERFQDTFSEDRSYKVLGKDISLSASAAARVDSWQLGIDRWIKRPLLGYGIPSATLVDNQYMLVLTETGIIGLLIFFWLIIRIFSMEWRTYQSCQDNNFAQGISLGAICGLVGILFQSFSSANFIIVRIMEPFWFLTAIIAGLDLIEREDNKIG